MMLSMFHWPDWPNRQRTYRLGAALLSLAALAIAGGTSGSATAAEADRKPWSVVLYVDTTPDSQLDDVDVDVNVSRFGAVFGWNLALGDSAHLKFTGEAEASTYDFSGSGTFGASDPFDEVRAIGVGARYLSTPKDGIHWFAALSVLGGADDGASLSDGIWFKGGGGMLFRVNDNFRLGFALIGRSQLEESAAFLPFPLIDWRINEKHRIGIIESADPALAYTYFWTDQVNLYASLNSSQRQYRIDDDISEDAAFVDEEHSLRVGITWKTHDGGFKADLFTGGVRRNLSLDVEGDEFAEDDVDPAPILGFAATISW